MYIDLLISAECHSELYSKVILAKFIKSFEICDRKRRINRSMESGCKHERYRIKLHSEQINKKTIEININ